MNGWKKLIAAVEQGCGMGSTAWDTIPPNEIIKASVLAWVQSQRGTLAEIDGELSAIAHGRQPSDKETLERLSQWVRRLYDR